MFFSGDPSTRKRVDLGGRSSKERDREEPSRADSSRTQPPLVAAPAELCCTQNPGFAFNCIWAGGDGSEEALDRLPTSATCMNLLKLTPYRSKQQLETKLLYAMNGDAGFDLS